MQVGAVSVTLCVVRPSARGGQVGGRSLLLSRPLRQRPRLKLPMPCPDSKQDHLNPEGALSWNAALLIKLVF